MNNIYDEEKVVEIDSAKCKRIAEDIEEKKIEFAKAFRFKYTDELDIALSHPVFAVKDKILSFVMNKLSYNDYYKLDELLHDEFKKLVLNTIFMARERKLFKYDLNTDDVIFDYKNLLTMYNEDEIPEEVVTKYKFVEYWVD